MPLSVKEFAEKVRARKPEYKHLDDADLLQMVTKKKPDLLKAIDRDDLVRVSNESVSKQVSKERQKQFGALSGYSRFMSGAGAGMLDVYNGVKQLFGGDVEEYKGDKEAYQDASRGSKTAAAGELFGALAATAPIPGVTGAKIASKVASPILKGAAAMGAAGATGAGFGASEFVDEGETRGRNAALGALFGAGGTGAAILTKKVGAKAFNALKGRYANADIQELMDLSKKYDIPLSEGDVTGKGKNVERALEGVPVVGMGGFRKEGAAKVQAAIKKEAEAVSPAWDDAIQESLANKAKAGKAQAKINYDRVEELSTGISIEPKNAIEKAAKHEADIAGSIMGSETNPFSKIRENLSKKGRTFSDLRRDRSDLQKAATKAADAGDRNLARQLNDVKAGIEADIEKLVDKKIEVGTFSQAKREAEGAAAIGFNPQTSLPNDMGEMIAPNRLMIGMDPGKELATIGKNEASLSGLSGSKPKVDISTKRPAHGVAPEMGIDPSSQKIMGTQGEGLREAFHAAQEHYKKEVVPYSDRKIINALKSETPDEIFNNFIKKGKGDRAGNFYNLLDAKGKSAFKDGLIDNAIKGATNPTTSEASPAKLAGYLQRMSDPIKSTLKGPELEQVKGLAKIMRHAERYGQLNESPSNGMSIIPYIKGLALGGAGYGAATNPIATAAGAAGAAGLTKLYSLMKTKGYKVNLASDKIGTPAFEKALNEIIAQLPKTSAVTGKEIQD